MKTYKHLPVPDRYYINGPPDVLRLVKKFYARKRVEIVLVLVVNRRKRALALIELSRGNSKETSFPVNEVMQIVLVYGGYGFVDMHNHIGIKNALLSSEADMDIFVDVQEAAATLGLEHLDSLIITPSGRYFSMSTNRPFRCPHCQRVSVICIQCTNFKRESRKFAWLPKSRRIRYLAKTQGI